MAYLYEYGRAFLAIEGLATATTPAEERRSLKTERFFVSLIYRIGGSR